MCSGVGLYGSTVWACLAGQASDEARVTTRCRQLEQEVQKKTRQLPVAARAAAGHALRTSDFSTRDFRAAASHSALSDVALHGFSYSLVTEQ